MNIAQLAEQIVVGESVTQDEISCLVSEVDLYDLMYWAHKIKLHFKGNVVSLCSVFNAKSGACKEDCKFCAQSVHHNVSFEQYPLKNGSESLNACKDAEHSGANRFGFVTSGGALTDRDFEEICKMIKATPQERLDVCASLGILTKIQTLKLKEMGVKRVHHNLETSRSFFPRICSTHDYDQRVETVRIVKRAGMEICCGGIFGLGESWEDRIELAVILRDLQVDAVPLNFLNPIKGTPLGGTSPLHPLEILRIISIYRFIMPSADISICGGREKNLRDMQSWIFYAGANGAMIGNYLTTQGRPPADDWQMISDCGLTCGSSLDKVSV